MWPFYIVTQDVSGPSLILNRKGFMWWCQRIIKKKKHLVQFILSNFRKAPNSNGWVDHISGDLCPQLKNSPPIIAPLEQRAVSFIHRPLPLKFVHTRDRERVISGAPIRRVTTLGVGVFVLRTVYRLSSLNNMQAASKDNWYRRHVRSYNRGWTSSAVGDQLDPRSNQTTWLLAPKQ